MLVLGRTVGQCIIVRFDQGPSVHVRHDESHIPVVVDLPKGVIAKTFSGVLHLRYKDQLASVRLAYRNRWRMQVEACERVAIIRV